MEHLSIISKIKQTYYKQYMFKDVNKEYQVIGNSTKVIEKDTQVLLAIFIKDFFTESECENINKFIESEHIPNVHKHKVGIGNDHLLFKIKAKVFDYNKDINDSLQKSFNTLHIFNNHIVDIHQDSEKSNIKNLFVTKHEDIIGLTVFPEYKMAFDIQNRDCLFFDTTMWHYACTNKMLSNQRCRYAMYFE